MNGTAKVVRFKRNWRLNIVGVVAELAANGYRRQITVSPLETTFKLFKNHKKGDIIPLNIHTGLPAGATTPCLTIAA